MIQYEEEFKFYDYTSGVFWTISQTKFDSF